MKTTPNAVIVDVLLQAMQACHRYDQSFNACLAEARKRFQREVNQEALNAPLPEK